MDTATSLSSASMMQEESSSFLDGFLTWLLRTRMSFYQYDLQLPGWFGAFCWNFALAGFIMFWTEPQWVRTRKICGRTFPYHAFAWLLILVQSPLSFTADYVLMTEDSYWHVADRLMALPLMGLEVLKLGLLCHDSFSKYQKSDDNNNTQNNNTAMHPALCGLYGMAVLFALWSFAQSNQAQAVLDRDGFVFWHGLWHLYPLLAAGITLVDFYVFHGWERSTREYLYRIEVHLLKRVSSQQKLR